MVGCLFFAHMAVGCMILCAAETPILYKNSLQVHLHSGAKGNFKQGYGGHVAFPLGLYLSSSI